MKGAYYNEFDPKAAAWLRELIRRNLIAPGDVDERSIEDVQPAELAGYSQCHFFAGIGVWSYALRRAGVEDSRRIWTGSCPCQPLSQAGKGRGFDDERHLWPAWHHLIDICRPPVLFGEQVASKAADSWADLVQDDLEALGYAFGAVPFPAASVGAPHIRDRLYWCAVADNAEQGRIARRRLGEASDGRDAPRVESGRLRDAGGVADSSSSTGLEVLGEQQARGQRTAAERSGETRILGDASSSRGGRDTGAISGAQGGLERQVRREPNFSEPAGAWSDCEWIYCRDQKWRPVEPGTFPLAHGAPARVGRLRGYGNAVVSEAARVWIETCIEAGV